MSVRVLSHSVPEAEGKRKVVRAVVAFEGPYREGGELIPAIQVSLSEIEWIDDAIAEGFVVRFGEEYPYTLRVFGKDSNTFDQVELEPGYDLSALDGVRLQVHGW